jgi:ribosomal protein RSM22 (predicted rRNA methylase)
MAWQQVRKFCVARTECVRGAQSSKGCGLTGAVAHPVESNQEASLWFRKRLSSSVLRDHSYDPMSRGSPVDPAKVVELDYISMCGLKTSELPSEVQVKVLRLLEQFGYKGDLERFGKYMVARFRSRASAETPKILPSVLIPEKALKHNQTALQRLFAAKGFADLRAAMPELFTTESASDLSSSLAQDAISNVEDQKHKIYQMFYSPGTAVTYLAHRFPSTFAANFRVLMEVFKRVPDLNPRRILDFGSGPAVSAQAALQIWQEEESRSITCVEPSLNMQQVGKYLLADSKVGEISWQIGIHGVKGQFDLITLSYVLMEIKDQDSRDLLVENLFSRLRQGGVLVIIECGTPTGFRYIHRIREQFISKDLGRVGQEKTFHIVGPCPHESACPLALTGKDWCHFDQQVRRLPHSAYSKGNKKNNTDFEKFSYLIIRKGPGPREEYGTERSAPTSWEKSYFWPRIVMPAIKAGGHTLVDVCARPNNFERLVVSRSNPHASGYRFSRKILWGDLWRFPKRLVRKDARGAYTPQKVKQHIEKLREEAKKAKEELKRFPEGQELEEHSYGQ